MHLYQKDITRISWADVEEFCKERPAENAYLDYKREFPSDLAKTIAAMANTYGGAVLIGIDEDSQGKPVLPFVGIPADRGLTERVQNIVVDSVSPPIEIQIAVCQSDDGTHAVIVIRVPQSELTPHALQLNTRVYIRTGNRNKPEESANLDRIEWLRNRRERAERFRESLFNRASTRFHSMADGRVPGIPRTEEHPTLASMMHPGVLTISLCPMYPVGNILAAPPRLDAIRREIQVNNSMGPGFQFPLPDGQAARLVEDGIVLYSSGKGNLRTYHTHLNMHGLYFYRQSLLYMPPPEQRSPNQKPYIRGYEVIARIFQMIESGSKLYENLAYRGPIQVRLSLAYLLGYAFMAPTSDGASAYERFSTDLNVEISTVVPVTLLATNVQGVVLSIAEHVGWAFDWEISDNLLATLKSQMNRR